MPDMPAKLSSVLLSVKDIAASIRLDKWVAGAIKERSRSQLRVLIETGFVAVDGDTVIDPAFKLRAGQKVEVSFPEPKKAEPEAQNIKLNIVFEDEHLIVVNKPAGMVVHPAPGNADKTLVNALLAHCGDTLKGIGGELRPGIVHRIDKDTSGLLVAAKDEATLAKLAEQFAAHTIERTYEAFVWGRPTPKEGTIEGNIGRSPRNRKKMAIVSRGGKHAETYYSTIKTFGEVATHLKCKLSTGRTHQIRVHLSSSGHPIIGDPLYGGSNRRALKHLPDESAQYIKGFPRQALHAASLGFRHPKTEKDMSFSCPLPPEMQTLLQVLESG